MKTLACLTLCVALATPAHAAAIVQLKAFMSGTKTLSASFSQTVSSKNGQEKASGQMEILRPGKLRWTYHTPYEQLIVGDGKTLWVYDQELAQITKRQQAGTLGSSPAALLAGSNAIERDYLLREIGKQGDVEWLAASPKKADNTFESIRMGFAANMLVEMELTDNFGNLTRIRFSDIRKNQPLPASRFTFTPPKGVDIVTE